MLRFILPIFILTETCITQALVTGHQGNHNNVEPESPDKSGNGYGVVYNYFLGVLQLAFTPLLSHQNHFHPMRGSFYF